MAKKKGVTRKAAPKKKTIKKPTTSTGPRRVKR